jgi:hypothetical protein
MTFRLFHCRISVPMEWSPLSTRLGLVAARESPNAIDADQMSRDIDDRPVFRSFVIVRRLGSIALALLDLLLRGC